MDEAHQQPAERRLDGRDRGADGSEQSRTSLYVGFWERKRTAWSLDSGGTNGGIFKTTDGGKTFKKLTKGLPTGKTGKIGLAIARSNPKVVMAHVEAEFQPEPNTPTSTT